MSALTGPLKLVLVEDPDPETVTHRRREAIDTFGFHIPPSQYELDFYARVGRPPARD